MKMLFYSSDNSEVDRVNEELQRAGIPCEVRKGHALNGKSARPAQAELWIRNDRDCHRAFLLCVQLGVGFAKRAPRKYLFDSSDFDMPMEEESDAKEGEAEASTNGRELRLVLVRRANQCK